MNSSATRPTGTPLIGHRTVSQRHGDGVIVVDLRTYNYIELDDVGGAMWEALRAHGDTESAARRLADEYDAPIDEIERDLAEFIESLASSGLLDDGHSVTGDADGETALSAESGEAADDAARLRDLYLDMTARAVCGLTAHGTGRDHLGHRVQGKPYILEDNRAVSLIGLPRLHHLRHLVERVIADDVPGDLMECGVWRGGAGIMMRATLVAHGVSDRRVWLADSFQGLPQTDVETYPLDEEWTAMAGRLAVSVDAVRRNVEAYGLLDETVHFLEGWFQDTLPTAPIEQLALLRLDGDLQESTHTALANLYHRVSPGGFVVIDDYQFASCRSAVDTFRSDHGITAELHHIDWCATFWQVPRDQPEV
jgi:hypothetical protein